MISISWNVNGIRAAAKKGLFEWFSAVRPDILSLQETKAQEEQLGSEFSDIPGYHSCYASAERKGYSGVACFSKERPRSVSLLESPEFDREGRGLVLEFPGFILINAYFPNSQAEGRRLSYKLEFCDMLLEKMNSLTAEGKSIVLCGDYNIAHKAIDLARPKENEGSPGYLPEERAWMDRFIAAGYADTFRMFNADGGNYTWWSYRTRGRERNVGWRLDYHCVNEDFVGKVIRSEILSNVMGSDHCPVSLEFDS
jgi:exodeoxyribonuclease-3